MFKINKKTEYALIALKHILLKNQPEVVTSAKEICESYGTPFDATSRVLQQLASRNWLTSAQGAYGGYRLSENIDTLNMKELCEIIEGPQAIVKCLSTDGKLAKCDLSTKCNMISPLSSLNHLLIDFLEGVKVVDLISDTKIPLNVSQNSTSFQSLEGE